MKLLHETNGQSIVVSGCDIAVHRCPVLVIGSGAAGLAAALRLYEAGVPDVIVLSEDRQAGTSRNTGSDKQTYYKLTLSGDEPDSVGRMAATLFNGGCMDGDLARVEAALSAACFHWLCDLGVPFPRNRYGEAVGYKTDHDPLCRASSAGPLTSRMMVEALERTLSDTPVRLMDRQQVVQLITDPEQNSIQGVLSLSVCDSMAERSGQQRYSLILAPYVVLAVGGPAMVYADSVYPGSQLGGTGLALLAGAQAVNLTEWQYGLASIAPRWNVSGSYQQVLPRYISTDPNGQDCRDFLADGIADRQSRLGLVFRKGYQWPFDVRKLNGSSLVDLLVYRETVLLKRRVFLDFCSNDCNRPFLPGELDAETADYLVRSDVTAELPWQRLRQMNEPAYNFYLERGVDLAREPLEIRLCAQHHNGGLAVDPDWQSTVTGLYPIGEVCGTHGVYRPGGSALNSGQVGAWRAAGHISRCLKHASGGAEQRCALPKNLISQLEKCLPTPDPTAQISTDDDQLAQRWQLAGERMSRLAGPFRAIGQLDQLLAETEQDLTESWYLLTAVTPAGLALAWRYRDLLVTQRFLLIAMLDYVRHNGASRGSALYLDAAGPTPAAGLPDFFRSRCDGLPLTDQVQVLSLQQPADPNGAISASWRPVRPLPHPDEAFEQVWRVWRRQQEGGAHP